MWRLCILQRNKSYTTVSFFQRFDTLALPSTALLSANATFDTVNTFLVLNYTRNRVASRQCLFASIKMWNIMSAVEFLPFWLLWAYTVSGTRLDRGVPGWSLLWGITNPFCPLALRGISHLHWVCFATFSLFFRPFVHSSFFRFVQSSCRYCCRANSLSFFISSVLMAI